jgi:tetratricopeptide (TPR) repeat protein
MSRMRIAIGSLLIAMLGVHPAVAETTRCEEPLKSALALDKAGKKSEAAPLFEKAIQLCTPAQSTAEKQGLAKAHIRLGIYDYGRNNAEALSHFRKAVELDPDNLAGSLDLAAALIALNAYADAIATAEKAIQHGSDDKDLMGQLEYNAGFAMLKLCVGRQSGCDKDKMEKHFLRTAELKPNYADTYFNLAAIMNDVHHDSRRAMALFKKACDLGHEQGCFQYAHFKSQMGD